MSGNGVEALIPVPEGPRRPSGCPRRLHVPARGLVAPSEIIHFSRMVNEDAAPGDVRTGRGGVTAQTVTVLEPIDNSAACECGRVDCTGTPYMVVAPALAGQEISLANFTAELAQELSESGTSFVCAGYLRSGWLG